jgi:hypothetical protein
MRRDEEASNMVPVSGFQSQREKSLSSRNNMILLFHCLCSAIRAAFY